MRSRTTIKLVAAPTVAGLALVAALSTFASGAAARNGPAVVTALPAAVSTFGSWSVPVNVGPIVNTADSEAGPALSADGLSVYFYNATRPGFGGNDIWVSQRATLSAPWGAPVNLGPTINSAASDFVPAFSADGHWMFFASDRPGGFGLADIYQSYRADVHNDFGWLTPMNVGAGVNCAADDNGVGYFDNGGHPQLFFGSGRLGGAARDLFLSTTLPNKAWGPATLISELSDPTATENRPTIRGDGLEIVFYSDRAGGAGGSDLWTATRKSVSAPWSAPVNLGPNVNSSTNEQHASMSANGATLVFLSGRPGGFGAADLYVSTRILPPDLRLPKLAIQATTLNPLGRHLKLTPVASESSGGQIAEICTPNLSLMFKIGKTVVQCTATGATGDSASGSFDVVITLKHSKKH
jgi:hypothetical protein